MRLATRASCSGRGHADGDIGLARQQVFAAIVEAQFDDEAGMDVAQLRQDRRQHFDGDDLAGGDAHRAGGGAGFGRRRAGESGGGIGHGLDMAGEFERNGGGDEAAGGAGEEGDAMVAFKIFDAAADGGLGEIERPGGAREAPLAQDGEKGALTFPIGRNVSHIFYTSRVKKIVNLWQGWRQPY
jgi:hypothetical protein